MPEQPDRQYVADRRVYARGEDGVNRLVARPGDIITESQARGYGLLDDDGTLRGTDRRPRADASRTTGTYKAVPQDTGAKADSDPDEDFPKHKGGPNWELSDGSTFKGSGDAAREAEQALHADADQEPGSDDGPGDGPAGDGDDGEGVGG